MGLSSIRGRGLEILRYKPNEIITAGIEVPFGFLTVVVEEPSHPSALPTGAPEPIDAVDMLPASGKFIIVMMDAVLLVAHGEQYVVGTP